MRKLILAAMAALTITVTTASGTMAAPYTPCQVGAFRQADMAGTYINSDMRLEIYTCGGSYLTWRNMYGVREAAYAGTGRLPTGGIIAKGLIGDPVTGGFMDNTMHIVYKPAEPGYIEVFTYDAITETFMGVYRLRKIG